MSRIPLLRRSDDASAGFAGIPLLGAAFISKHIDRLISLVVVTTVALLACGMTGAWLGGAGVMKPTVRVLIGGCVLNAAPDRISSSIAPSFTYRMRRRYVTVSKPHVRVLIHLQSCARGRSWVVKVELQDYCTHSTSMAAHAVALLESELGGCTRRSASQCTHH